MKFLYKFTVNKDAEVEEVQTVQDATGNPIEAKVKVIKSVPVSFGIKKPSRRQFDEADLFYAVELSSGIKAGLLQKASLSKRLSNDGGILSDNQKKAIDAAYLDFYNQNLSLKKLTDLAEKTEENKAEIISLEAKIFALGKQIQDFESAQASIFDQTAEVKARNRTILFWVLNLSYDNSEKPFFGDGDFEKKLLKYDELDETDDVFTQKVIKNFIYYVSFWYTGRANSQEDFDKISKLIDEPKSA